MSDILRVTGLKKTYPGFALDDVNLSVEAGTIAGFVGRNGAGKTTTIKAILGLVSPDEGEIELLGRRVGPEPASRTPLLERIGVVLDACPFPADLRVGDLERIGRVNYPTWSDAEFARRVSDFGLDPKKKVKELSRGMGMMLQFAFVLSHLPSLLILDEATAGLDPIARDEMIEVLLAFVAEGERAILLSTHITSDLDSCADTITCIDAGRIVFSMPKDDITNRAGIVTYPADYRPPASSPADPPASPIRTLPGAYSTRLLVEDRFAYQKQFPEAHCEPVNVETYMRMLLGRIN